MSFPTKNWRRLTPLLLIAAGLTLAHTTAQELPRDQEIRFVLADALRDAKALRAHYAEQGEEPAAGVEVRFGNGAPSEVIHTPSLRPGRYDVSVELTRASGQKEQWVRAITVPSDGPLRLRLGGTERAR